MLLPRFIRSGSVSSACMKLAFVLSASVVPLLMTSPVLATSVTPFATPGSWSVGSANTTYQEWDDLSGATTASPKTPDVGHTINPTVLAAPTIAPVALGFATGSGNFYAYGGNYGFQAKISNHTGASGTGLGTHVIVQFASSLNGDQGVTDLNIVKQDGSAIAGVTQLRSDTLFTEIASTSQGDTPYHGKIYEFYLPNYIGDFRVDGDVFVHASFDRLRVDTALATQAFGLTQVPEPSSAFLLVSLAAGALGLPSIRRPRGRNRG